MTLRIIKNNTMPRREGDRFVTERPRHLLTTRDIAQTVMGIPFSWDHGICGRAVQVGKNPYNGLMMGTFLTAVKVATNRGRRPYNREDVAYLGDICPACERIFFAHAELAA